MTETLGLPHVLYEDLPMARDRGAGWGKLRGLGPLLYGDGWYYFTRRDDVLTALRDPETYSSRTDYDDMISPVPLVPLGFDPPEHTRYRRLLHPYFSPQTLSALLPSLRAQVIDIIDEIATRPDCEVMADLAIPYPSQVFLTLFGLPLEDRERLIAWKDAIIAVSLATDPNSVDLTPAAELFGYLAEAVRAQRESPQAGILSDVLHARMRSPTPRRRACRSCSSSPASTRSPPRSVPPCWSWPVVRTCAVDSGSNPTTSAPSSRR